MSAQDDGWVLTDLGPGGLPPTEAPNPASQGIDAKSALEIVRQIHAEDLRAFEAVGSALGSIAELAEDVHEAFRRGGRLIYFGAGTSGRLGVLDASECLPTFGVGPDRVLGFIAGGERALRSPVEGAEDSADGGAEAVRAAQVGGSDVVCGIAASGTTPYVWGALREARSRGALAALVTCNPGWAKLEGASCVSRAVVLDVGPEILAGSTRMKAGTATKLVLNMLTTTAMIRWGKVHDNLMVDLTPVNRKLKRRAVGLVTRIAGVDPARAVELLRATGGDVKAAIVMGGRGVSLESARSLLASSEGRLRQALGGPLRG